MALSNNDKLTIALELLPDRDIEIYRAICTLAEQKNIDIYEALTSSQSKG